MSREDYDDMVSNNSHRGRESTRRTILGVAFFIIISLIVIVVYLIMNPSQSIEISKKVETGGSAEKEKSVSLFNFQIQSEEDDNLSLSQIETKNTLSESKATSFIEASTLEKTEPQVDSVSINSITNINGEDATINEEVVTQFEKADTEEENIALFEERERLDSISNESDFSPINTEVDNGLPQKEDAIEETNTQFYTTVEEIAAVTNTIRVEEEASQEINVDAPIEDDQLSNPLFSLNKDDVITNGEIREDNGVFILTGKNGSSVRALFEGLVTELGKDDKGKYVIISSAEGWSIKYSGFERIVVKNKVYLSSGTVIGSIGSSSQSITLEYIPAN